MALPSARSFLETANSIQVPNVAEPGEFKSPASHLLFVLGLDVFAPETLLKVGVDRPR